MEKWYFHIFLKFFIVAFDRKKNWGKKRIYKKMPFRWTFSTFQQFFLPKSAKFWKNTFEPNMVEYGQTYGQTSKELMFKAGYGTKNRIPTLGGYLTSLEKSGHFSYLFWLKRSVVGQNGSKNRAKNRANF